ncbi:MAG: hypothetical protein A2275_08570 [Bacteroidetes bacterium RIFOXYA12_FULL_35_11]|nr:MAG: hypothetical protein A2X01_09385 [Bacteroidetes bacterium GWF2_35_48]OFY75982.1 MAG: hypothetical protein A2275_08570 [Bacteroidetes bacterium RIFOXYA12_FULL_35_11]OFY95715.1 MAG: hypothetical protein A2309_04760 [Bacteroidetes bacterium RIFOXYB2_FULL_35_7]HBX53687.1 hypothetical protein [Bacteroidales bacterium]
MLRFIIHYFLHLIAPGIIARVFFKEQWIKAWLIMLLTLLIDLDHLFSQTLYNPCRCSLEVHPLHSIIAIGLYLALFIIPKTRVIGLGLLFHVFTDALDCLFIFHFC